MRHAKAITALLVVTGGLLMAPRPVGANPYPATPGEAPVSIKIATCAIAGGFIHLYAALDANLFEKYGLRVEHIGIRGSSPSLAALAADEVQFLYCSGDATAPGLASGIDAKFIATPLVGQPWVLLAHKDVKRPEDLKGKAIGVSGLFHNDEGRAQVRFSNISALLGQQTATTSEVQRLAIDLFVRRSHALFEQALW